jgi:biopolymer transport protein ExbD
VQTEDLLSCNLAESGALIVGGKTVTGSELQKLIEEKRANHPNMTFLLVISPDTPYQRVVDVIHQVRAQRIENFSFRMDGGAK